MVTGNLPDHKAITCDRGWRILVRDQEHIRRTRSGRKGKRLDAGLKKRTALKRQRGRDALQNIGVRPLKLLLLQYDKGNQCSPPRLPAALDGRGNLRLLYRPDHNGPSLAYVYFEEEPGRSSGPACCSGGLDPALTEFVGVVLSSSARAETHAKLIRKARVRADATRVLSTNDTSLPMPLKKETPLACSRSQSPIA